MIFFKFICLWILFNQLDRIIKQLKLTNKKIDTLVDFYVLEKHSEKDLYRFRLIKGYEIDGFK